MNQPATKDDLRAALDASTRRITINVTIMFAIMLACAAAGIWLAYELALHHAAN